MYTIYSKADGTRIVIPPHALYVRESLYEL